MYKFTEIVKDNSNGGENMMESFKKMGRILWSLIVFAAVVILVSGCGPI